MWKERKKYSQGKKYSYKIDLNTKNYSAELQGTNSFICVDSNHVACIVIQDKRRRLSFLVVYMHTSRRYSLLPYSFWPCFHQFSILTFVWKWLQLYIYPSWNENKETNNKSQEKNLETKERYKAKVSEFLNNVWSLWPIGVCVCVCLIFMSVSSEIIA